MWNVSNQNYVIYHLHTDDSLLDSCTKYQDYIDKAVADGCKAIAFTEHGNIYHWIKKKMYCDAKGIKYIHGVECYLTRTHEEKVRDNYHTILLAKNYDGVKEINKLCELATTSDHRYYKPRISFDEFLNISDNVIKISACLASPLNQYRKEYGENEIFDRIARHYDYYEIQYHNVVEQKEYNQFLYQLSKKNNIPLIAGTDTHSLTKYLADCRTILQLGKNIVFSQEDDFDLTYKTYNDLVVAFSQQDCLPKEVVLDAINNTNKMADTVESFDLDLSFKYPILYGDDDEQVLWNTLRDKYMYKKKNHIIDVAKEQQYVDNIKEEMRVFNKIGMTGFMLFMSEMITWCKNNGIPVGFNRGCFTKHALVQTKQQLKTINNVHIGDYVLSSDGNWNKVLNTMQYDIKEDMIKFEYDRQGSSAKKYINQCTTDHKILVNRNSEILYIAAKDLRIGDLLCSPKIKHHNTHDNIIVDLQKYNKFGYEFDDKYIYEEVRTNIPFKYSSRWCAKNIGSNTAFWKDIANRDVGGELAKKNIEKLFKISGFNNLEEYRNYLQKHRTVKRRIPRYIKIDYLWNVFIGLMYGDGWTQKDYGIGLAVNRTTKASFNRYVFCKIAERLGVPYVVNQAKNRNLEQLNISSKIINNWFSVEFFKSKKRQDKIFNTELYNQNKDMLKGLYIGLLKSDGSVKHNNIVFDNTSLSVIEAFKILDNILYGVEPLALDVRLSYIDNRKYVNRESYKLRRRIAPKNRVVLQDNNYWFLPITNIELLKDVSTTVYDMTVDNNASYTINNVVVHNSVGGSTVAYISDIIDTDPVKWNTVFSRFANEDRKEIGDIDIDVSPSQRQQVFDYIINRFGQEKTAYVLSMGTISDKGTIDLIGRAFRQKATSDSTINKENYSLQHIAEIKKQYDTNPDKTKKDNPEIFKYFDGLVDTTVSQSHHPAGIIASPVTLGDNYGCFYDADDNRIMYIDMEEVHEVSLVKYDILGLKNIEILKDTCELAHIPYPQSHKVNWNDEKVFTDLIKSPVGIFQFESQFAFDSLKKFKPKSVQDISLVTAAIRPSGESYRDKLLAHEVNHNPSKQIDDMLANNNGFLTYQEDIIKFLKDICGLSGSEADNIRRAIGRKDKERLDKALPEILEGYCNKSEKPREIAEQAAREFLQIIEDSSNYSFGYNHSIGYSMITYICAMLRCYYPIEFCTAYLNNAKNDEDITNGTELAKSLGFKIKSPVFRHSRSKYMCDKENNTIYQGIGAIKNIGADVGEILYQYKDYEFNSFIDVLSTININKTCLEILIQIGFFREFGDINTLNYIYDVYKKYHKSKTIKKDSLSDFEIEQIQGCFEKETDKQYRGIDNKRFINNLINNADIQKTSDIEILKNQMSLLGYSDIKIETADIHKYMVEDLTIDKYKRPWVSLYNLRCGVSKSGIQIRSKAYSGLNVGDIIIAIFKDKPIKKYMGEDEYGNKQYRNTGQTRRWIWTYRKDN